MPGRLAWLRSERTLFWVGVVLLLCASATLEWSRLYSLEPRLPGGHAGGVLGYLVGPLAVKWLGFAGSGLVAIALGVVGALVAANLILGGAFL